MVKWVWVSDEEKYSALDPLAHVAFLSQLDAFQPGFGDEVVFDGLDGRALDLWEVSWLGANKGGADICLNRVSDKERTESNDHIAARSYTLIHSSKVDG